MFKKLFSKIDQIICSYLGLDTEIIKTAEVELEGKTLRVKYTNSYKRHAVSAAWEELPEQSSQELANLGEQAAQAMAKDLIITFKQPDIRIETHA